MAQTLQMVEKTTPKTKERRVFDITIEANYTE
jgi:hypothetical protein